MVSVLARGGWMVACALFLVTGVVRSQGVRIVEAPGLGSLPDIQSAVDAAADGDTLLVAPGSYAGFVIDGKQLSVLATVEGAVFVDGTLEIRKANGKLATLVAGLDVTGDRVGPTSEPGVLVEDCKGAVRLQSCVFRGGRGSVDSFGNFGDGGVGAIVTNSSRVALLDCELRGGEGYGIEEGNYYPPGGDGGLGLSTAGSAVALYDCLVLGGGGGNAGIFAGDGGGGCHVLDFGIFASGCSFTGGGGGFAWDFIDAYGGDGGDGLEVSTYGQAQLVDNEYVRGPGGGSVVGTPGAPGEATSGSGFFKYHAGAARVLAADYLAPATEPWRIDVAGEAGDLVFLAAAVQPAWIVPFPKSGIWLVPIPMYFQWPPLAVLPPGGTATITIPGAAVHGNQGSQVFFSQGFVRDPDQAYDRLGSALHLVRLDAAAPPDCDGSGTSDLVELLQGVLADCDSDLEPDLCEIAAGTEPDCNANLVPDVCDLSAGTSTDCDGSGIPDECEALPDCNGNSTPDVCDILFGTSEDQNSNGIPDECEVGGLTWYCDPTAPPGGNGTLGAPFDTIDQAISAALSGDTIELLDGVFQGPGNQSLFFQGKELVLRSQNGPGACTIDPAGFRGLDIVGGQTAATRVEGITFANAFQGIEIRNSDPVISNCVFSDCYDSVGAGMLISNSRARVEDCQFLGNSTFQGASFTGVGGGMYVTNGGLAVITRCLFEGNTAGAGGGLAVGGPTPVVVSHCVFRDNVALDGGAISNESFFNGAFQERLLLDDCLLEGNQGTRGGGVYVDADGFGGFVSALRMTGCTLVGNTATASGGGLFAIGRCELTVSNSILFANSAPAGLQIALEEEETTLTADYNDVQGGLAGLLLTGGPTVSWGAGNIDVPPQFQAPAQGDYRLGPGSPCIDAGSNALVPQDLSDIDGDGDLTEPVPLDLDLTPRFVDDPLVPDTGSGAPPLIDMGAYESTESGPNPTPNRSPAATTRVHGR